MRSFTTAVIAAALLATIATVPVRAAPLYVTDILEPFTLPYDQSLRPWTINMPLDDATVSIGADAPADQPTQVHLSLAGDNAFFVAWATEEAKVGNGTLAQNALTPSIVHYGTSESDLDLIANGSALVYDQIYPAGNTSVNETNALNYTSPVLHTVILDDLEPNTTYYYRVGDGSIFSQVFSFRSLAAVGDSAYPQTIAAIADWGYSYNSSSTLQHILASVAEGENVNPPVIFYIGDYCYADNWLANGTQSATNVTSADGFEGISSNTYQPVWDAWMRFLQPLVSEVPMVGAVGNHEIEQQNDPDVTIFKSVISRWPLSDDSGSYHFHSHEFGAVHAIFLSVYVDYTPGSAQWTWLNQDLQKVNRTKTPWVTVSFHNPWYTTDGSYKEFEQMRVSMEPLTYHYGVDVFFYGHVHSYERTAPVNNYLVDPCGSVHLTVGDGGNSEGISDITGSNVFADTEHQYEDLNGGCPNITADYRAGFLYLSIGNTSDPFSYYRATLTFQADGNSTGAPGQYPPGFCYKQQPLWSQYRESSFGHGTLKLLDDTTALWQWHRNQDSVAVAADQAYITRNTTLCPNKLGAAAYTSGVGASQGLQTSSIQNAGK